MTPERTLLLAVTIPIMATHSLPAVNLPAGGSDEMAERIAFASGVVAPDVSGTLAAGNE